MSSNLSVMADNVADNGSAVVAAAASQPGWQAEFCERYSGILLAYGRWFLLGALIIGLIGAIVMVVNSLNQPGAGEGEEDEGGGGMLQSAVAAVTALVEAFAKAPTWLAMLGGGVLLLWMAGNAPQLCTCAAGTPGCVADTSSGDEDSNTAANATNTAADSASNDAAGDESGGGNSSS